MDILHFIYLFAVLALAAHILYICLLVDGQFGSFYFGFYEFVDIRVQVCFVCVCVCVCVCVYKFYVCVCLLSCFSHVQLFVTLWTVACQLLCPWDSPGKNTGVGCHDLL